MHARACLCVDISLAQQWMCNLFWFLNFSVDSSVRMQTSHSKSVFVSSSFNSFPFFPQCSPAAGQHLHLSDIRSTGPSLRSAYCSTSIGELILWRTTSTFQGSVCSQLSLSLSLSLSLTHSLSLSEKTLLHRQDVVLRAPQTIIAPLSCHVMFAFIYPCRPGRRTWQVASPV